MQDEGAGPTVRRTQFPAFGGIATVLVTGGADVAAAEAAVRTVVRAFDAACSRFRPDSELTRVNAAAGAPVPVSRLFALALTTALRTAELTGGDVDPTCGAALAAAGYDRDFALLGAAGSRVVARAPVPAPGWRSVSWDPDRRVVRIPPGTRLDFGATAKALAADRAAARASAVAAGGVLVSLGGDLATRGAAPAGGWLVAVTDDHRAGPRDRGSGTGLEYRAEGTVAWDTAAGSTATDETAGAAGAGGRAETGSRAAAAPIAGQIVALRSGGLATSGTTVRRWQAGPAELHHIVDPASGRPVASCWRTVTVAAADCVDANAAATASIVRGAAAPAWLGDLRLPARFVRHDGSVVSTAGWPGA